MLVDQSTLAELCLNVCQNMLGLETTVERRFQPLGSDSLTASVRISGAWNALVQVQAPKDFVTTLAGAMFMQDAQGLSDDEIFDSFGELANILGGNVKGVIDRECQLSLPCVGTSGEAVELAADDQIALGLRVGPHRAVVNVYEWTAAPTLATA